MGRGVVSRPIFSLSIESSSASYTLSGAAYDYAVAGKPFYSFASPEVPMERALAPIRKQQVDQSDNPGEQSLDAWWLRSQTDWSGGAGLAYMEPASNERVQRSFDSSAGVDPWDIGLLKLLRSTASLRTIASSSTPYVLRHNTTGGLYFGAGSTIDMYNGTTWTATTGFTGTLARLNLAGDKVLATNTSGTIFSTSVGGTTFASLWTTANGATKGWWVKQRMIVAQGAKLFELGLAGGNLDLQSPFYTHPDSTWTWTTAFEAPGAILVAGYGAAGSAVYKFILQTSGALPTVSGAITTAEFPVGEYITDALTYLGSYIAIATNLGVRVGQVSQTGDITYGPFTYQGATLGRFVPYSRFVYTEVADAGEGRQGLIRIDLSDIGDDGRAPWSNDIRVPVGVSDTVTSFTVVSDQQVYLTTQGASATLYGCTSASNVESSGWLRTGYVRYGTIENKNYDSVRVDLTKPVSGTVTISSVDQAGNVTGLGSYGPTTSTDDVLKIAAPTTPQRHLALKFTLAPQAGALTVSPVLESWQLRAVPAPIRAELQQIPLMCFDFEKDEYGQPTGYEGSALARWQELREAVRDSRTIRLQNLKTGEATSCIVEEMSFKQLASPVRASGFGGVILLTVRSL